MLYCSVAKWTLVPRPFIDALYWMIDYGLAERSLKTKSAL